MRKAAGFAGGSEGVASPEMVDEALRRGARAAASDPEPPSPRHRESSESDELSAFLGKNYIGLDMEDFDPSESKAALRSTAPLKDDDFFGLGDPILHASDSTSSLTTARARSERRRVRGGEEGVSASSTSGERPSALTSVQKLELDMDAMRSVRNKRRKTTEKERQHTREKFDLVDAPSRDSPIPLLISFGGVIGLYLTFVVLSAVTSMMPAIVRVLIALSPLIAAVGWVALEHHDEDSFTRRWIAPVSLRLLILFGCSCLLVALILPEQASTSLSEHGAWFFDPLPEIAPFTWGRRVTEGVAHGFGAFFDAIASLLPW